MEGVHRGQFSGVDSFLLGRRFSGRVSHCFLQLHHVCDLWLTLLPRLPPCCKNAQITNVSSSIQHLGFFSTWAPGITLKQQVWAPWAFTHELLPWPIKLTCFYLIPFSFSLSIGWSPNEPFPKRAFHSHLCSPGFISHSTYLNHTTAARTFLHFHKKPCLLSFTSLVALCPISGTLIVL